MGSCEVKFHQTRGRGLPAEVHVPISRNGQAYAGAKLAILRLVVIYSDMTYSKAVPVRPTEGAAGLNSNAMSWFVPPLVASASGSSASRVYRVPGLSLTVSQGSQRLSH